MYITTQYYTTVHRVQYSKYSTPSPSQAQKAEEDLLEQVRILKKEKTELENRAEDAERKVKQLEHEREVLEGVCLCLSVCLSAGLSVCLSVCLSVFLSVCLSVCHSICSSLYPVS